MEQHYIYALRYEQRWLYIGRTKNPSYRKSAHKNRKKNKCGSADIPESIDWEFVIIDDECDETNVLYWEAYYINLYEPEFNRMRPRIQNYTCSR